MSDEAKTPDNYHAIQAKQIWPKRASGVMVDVVLASDYATLKARREADKALMDGMQRECADAHNENARLRGGLERCRQRHIECQDGWFSCPKSEGGCFDEGAGDDCTCGADETNAIIDAALTEEGADEL